MKEAYTHISIILDRTGSMEMIRDDLIGGFNAFLREQKDLREKATLTLVQFDSQDPYEVIHNFVPLSDAVELTRASYVPRASTPLLDAMGRGINGLERKLTGIEDGKRPSKVIMVIVTDGRENASQEFNQEQIKKMVEEKQEKDGWQFVFLSADLEAIVNARQIGVPYGSTLAFDKTFKGNTYAWSSLSERVAECRESEVGKFVFREDDRKKQVLERKKRGI